MSDCEHKFSYQGLQYADGSNNLPGSGAKRRYYAHTFFCEKCLEKRTESVGYPDECSYSSPKDGATRGDRNLIVPKSDQSRH